MVADHLLSRGDWRDGAGIPSQHHPDVRPSLRSAWGGGDMFDNGIDRIDWISPSSKLIGMNDAGCRAFDTTVAHGRGNDWEELWSDDSRVTIARHLDLARAEGRTRFTAASDVGGQRSWWDVVLSVTPGGGLVAQARDTTASNAAIERYRHLSTHDELTGLLNRAALKDAIDRAVGHNSEVRRSGAILMLDLDNFKLINDTMGHDVGDLALRAVGQRMGDVLSNNGVAARLGGDEFAAVLPHVSDHDHLRTIIERLLEALAQPVDMKGRTLCPRASVGVALFPKHGQTAAALLKHADIALYAAKSFGRGGYVTFVSSMNGAIRRRASASAAIQSALADNRIDAFYQPIVDLESNRLLGFEAKSQIFLRDGSAMAAPDIALIRDDVELATAMSARIFNKVMEDVRSWRDGGLAVAPIAINACAAEFRGDDYAERFLTRIDDAGLPHDLFGLEVAETVFGGRGTDYVGSALKRLSAAGVKIALDEFGSGPASLSHLKRLPVSSIKIDGSFVETIEHGQSDRAIIRAMVGLANGFGIGLAADRVDTIGQAHALTGLGCRIGQGALFGHPEPASAVAARLSNYAK